MRKYGGSAHGVAFPAREESPSRHAVDAALADRDTPKAGGFDGICFELAPRMREVLLRFPGRRSASSAMNSERA